MGSGLLTCASGIVRLENTGVLVPHLLSSHTSKKSKHYLISDSLWLWYNSFKLPMRTHEMCSAGLVFEQSHGAASAQRQFRCSCAAWRVPAKPVCSICLLRDRAEMSFHELCVPGVTHPALFLCDRICVVLCQGPLCSMAMT